MTLSDMLSNPYIGAGLGLTQSGGQSSTPMGIGGLIAGGLGGGMKSIMHGQLMEQLLRQFGQGSNGFLPDPQLSGLFGNQQANYGGGTNSLMNLSYPQIQQLSGQQ